MNSIENRISTISRQAIADELTVARLYYYGQQVEPDFLSRLYDLRNMPSNDPRYDNAYDDIHKHMVMNSDWGDDWVFTSPRFNLMYGPDEEFLRFLAETLHPRTRSKQEEVDQLLTIYHRHLSAGGYELVATGEMSGRPVYSGQRIGDRQADAAARKVAIRKYLDTDYVSTKIDLMNKSVLTDTDLAIGTAKELLETVCKSILKQRGLAVDAGWGVARLLKETTNAMAFQPKHADDPASAERSIRQILSGISTAVQGVTELRNAYGSGHGKDADFRGLEPKYARLVVGLVAEVALLLLASNVGQVELIEQELAVSNDLPF